MRIWKRKKGSNLVPGVLQSKARLGCEHQKGLTRNIQRVLQASRYLDLQRKDRNLERREEVGKCYRKAFHFVILCTNPFSVIKGFRIILLNTMVKLFDICLNILGRRIQTLKKVELYQSDAIHGYDTVTVYSLNNKYMMRNIVQYCQYQGERNNSETG